MEIIDQIRHLYEQGMKEIFPQVHNKNHEHRTLTYFGRTTNKMTSFLKKRGIQTALKTNNTLSIHIKNNKGTLDKHKCQVLIN